MSPETFALGGGCFGTVNGSRQIPDYSVILKKENPESAVWLSGW